MIEKGHAVFVQTQADIGAGFTDDDYINPGECEWKVRTHRAAKRRTWRKLHLGIDKKNGEILAAMGTTNDLADCEVLPDLLEQIYQEIEHGQFDNVV